MSKVLLLVLSIIFICDFSRPINSNIQQSSIFLNLCVMDTKAKETTNLWLWMSID